MPQELHGVPVKNRVNSYLLSLLLTLHLESAYAGVTSPSRRTLRSNLSSCDLYLDVLMLLDAVTNFLHQPLFPTVHWEPKKAHETKPFLLLKSLEFLPPGVNMSTIEIQRCRIIASSLLVAEEYKSVDVSSSSNKFEDS